MSHSSSRAALLYQHMPGDRDRALAIRDGGGDPSGKVDKDFTRTCHACGTAPETVKGQPGRETLLSWPFSLCPPAEFEPVTPAVGVRSKPAPAVAVA
jgi:hypothetical protein